MRFMRIACVIKKIRMKVGGGQFAPPPLLRIEKNTQKTQKTHEIRMKYALKRIKNAWKTQKNAFNTPVRIDILNTHNTQEKRTQKNA